MLHAATFDVAYGRWVGGSQYVSTPTIEIDAPANANAPFYLGSDGLFSFAPHPGYGSPGETFHFQYRLHWIGSSGAFTSDVSEWANVTIHVKTPNVATTENGAYVVEDASFSNLATDGTQTEITVGTLARSVVELPLSKPKTIETIWRILIKYSVFLLILIPLAFRKLSFSWVAL